LLCSTLPSFILCRSLGREGSCLQISWGQIEGCCSVFAGHRNSQRSRDRRTNSHASWGCQGESRRKGYHQGPSFPEPFRGEHQSASYWHRTYKICRPLQSPLPKLRSRPDALYAGYYSKESCDLHSILVHIYHYNDNVSIPFLLTCIVDSIIQLSFSSTRAIFRGTLAENQYVCMAVKENR